MKRIVIVLLCGILFLSACGGPVPAANTPVINNTADAPASTPTVAPTEVVIPIPKVVLSNNLTGATDDTGVTPTSINDLDLSVVGGDQVGVVGKIKEIAGADAENIKSWNISWLWANGMLNNEDGTSPKTYEEAVTVADERYEFVGNQLESGPWSIAIKEKKTKRIGYAVNSNGVPFDASLMSIGATSLDDFDIMFFDMPEGGTDQFLTNNGSVFSIIVVDENRQPISWLHTATGEIVAEREVLDDGLDWGYIETHRLPLPESVLMNGVEMRVKLGVDQSMSGKIEKIKLHEDGWKSNSGNNAIDALPSFTQRMFYDIWINNQKAVGNGLESTDFKTWIAWVAEAQKDQTSEAWGRVAVEIFVNDPTTTFELKKVKVAPFYNGGVLPEGMQGMSAIDYVFASSKSAKNMKVFDENIG